MPYREPTSNRVVYWLGELGSGFKPRSLSGYQDIDKIRKTCKAKEVYFEDEEFPANETSIGTSDANSYEWKRPHEIVPEGSFPEFIVDGAERFDVRQGNLGNCWLLAAVADLTLDQKTTDFILCKKDNSFVKKYQGVFHFRFWQYGKWIDIVVDDRLPVHKKTGKLAFMNSESKNEFWGSLLEKAYAKLNGSYNALVTGYTIEALEDFTGGFTEIFMLSQYKETKEGSNFFKDMERYFKRGSFMGSSAKADKSIKESRLPNGLVQGHAYSITDMRRVPVKNNPSVGIELMRLRNPWGNSVEWNGDFSDCSSCWNEYFNDDDIADINNTFQADGEFWMTVTDFLDQFERLEACHVFPFDMNDESEKTKFGELIVHSFVGKWTRGVTCGGPRALDGQLNQIYENNPQFELNFSPKAQKDAVVISLMKNERKSETMDDIGKFSFDIFDVTNSKNLPIPLDSDFFARNAPMKKTEPPSGPREKTIRFELAKGRYIIVPSTKAQDLDGHFLLRVITEGESSMNKYDNTVHQKETHVEIKEYTAEEIEEERAYKEFFKEIAGDDAQVDWWELKMMLDTKFHSEFKHEGFSFSEDQCRSMVALYDSDFSGKLGFYEFMKLWLNIKKWKSIFEKYSERQEEGPRRIRTPNLLKALGEANYVVTKDIISVFVLRYGDRRGDLWMGQFIVAAVKLEAMFEQFKLFDVDNKDQALVTFGNWLSSTIYS